MLARWPPVCIAYARNSINASKQENMEDKKYSKLKAAFEATQPQVPADFTGRVMKRIEEQPSVYQSKRRRVWQYPIIAAVAASLLLIIGIGALIWMQRGNETQMPDKSLAVTTHVDRSPRPSYPETSNLRTSTSQPHASRSVRTLRTQSPLPTHPESAPDGLTSAPNEDCSQTEPVTQEEPRLHYATHIQTKTDTVSYQDPVRVDEFIAKMADYYDVRQGELTCSVHADSNVVSTVYVFPDKQDINLFNRLLQVACWYSDETPGYLLSFSHRQFFFELKDVRRQLQYRWIAERINGKILLYGTNAPIGAETSSACYQEYRDELMHTRRITPKTRDI